MHPKVGKLRMRVS